MSDALLLWHTSSKLWRNDRYEKRNIALRDTSFGNDFDTLYVRSAATRPSPVERARCDATATGSIAGQPAEFRPGYAAAVSTAELRSEHATATQFPIA